MTETTHLAVLGDPIAHSRSPRIHAAAYAALGLDWRYSAVRCGAAELASFIDGRGPEWRGFSLTMPLKEEAYRIARVLDPVARESGVVNTLSRLPGGGWAGANTDVPGLAAAIGEAGLDTTRTLIIGSGATAVSAILAARRLGAERIDVMARNLSALDGLVSRFSGTSEPDGAAIEVVGVPLSVTAESDGAALPGAAGARDPSLVISTLPGRAAAAIELSDVLHGVPLFDVAYDPWPSPFAKRWSAAGGTAVQGIEMLVCQALVQVRIFTGTGAQTPLADERRVLEEMRRAAG